MTNDVVAPFYWHIMILFNGLMTGRFKKTVGSQISHWEAAARAQLLMVGWQISWLLCFPGNKPVLDRIYLITQIENVLACALLFVHVYNKDFLLFRSTIQTHPRRKPVDLHPFRSDVQVTVAYWPAYQWGYPDPTGNHPLDCPLPMESGGPRWVLEARVPSFQSRSSRHQSCLTSRVQTTRNCPQPAGRQL